MNKLRLPEWTPQNVEDLREATVAWCRQHVPNSQDLTKQELFKAYPAYKKELSKKVRQVIRKIPDSVLHHKMNLNSRTIARLRNGKDLQMNTLERLRRYKGSDRKQASQHIAQP